MIDRKELSPIVTQQRVDELTTTAGHKINWILPLSNKDGGYVLSVTEWIDDVKHVQRVYTVDEEGLEDYEDIELIKREDPPKVHELKAYIPVYEGPGNDIWLGPSAPTLERARARQSVVGKLIAVLPADLKFKEGDNLA